MIHVCTYVTHYLRLGALRGNVTDQYLGLKGNTVNKNVWCDRIAEDKKYARIILLFRTKVKNTKYTT